ncbi:MAG TPA: YbaK/EbsC family protein [Anaerolineales bacterium]|nr:YbaK/EbsC family protein [Anaerolineales bacterium]
MAATPVTLALDEAHVPYTLHLHGHPVTSLEQAAAERGLRPGQIVRSLVFRSQDGTYLLVLAPGPQQVSWAKLRRHLGISRLTTASAQDVLQVTGYPPGAVSPLALATPMRILADHSVSGEETVSIGAGIPDAGVVLRTDDLLRLVQPEMGDFLEGGNPDPQSPFPTPPE